MERLEVRVRELEEEVGRSRARSSQSSRTHQQALATVRRLEVHQDEEERCRERMVALVEGLERQVGGYRRQVEEAQEVAATNLAKYRRVQQELEEVEERARAAEDRGAEARARGAEAGPDDLTALLSRQSAKEREERSQQDEIFNLLTRWHHLLH